jgi:autotransporter-associated beta strand protein
MLRTTVLAGGVIAGLLVFWSAPARAQDATWLASPATAIYNEGANWTGGSVPTGTATFEASNQRNLTVNGFTIGGWVFNVGAGDYTFTTNSLHQIIQFNGSGIQVNSGSSATIIGNGFLGFYDTSSAGSATITYANYLAFLNSSSAGSATITNNDEMEFSNTSSAGSATITNNRMLYFTDNSSAGSATITNNDGLLFYQTSSAGSATITTTSGAAIHVGFNGNGTNFVDSATGGTSRHIVNSGGLLDITGLSAAGLTIGSLEGSGLVAIGGKTLTIGANNLSTTFSGVIQNQGHQPGSGALAGSLAKTGTGTLILSGTNTYTGTTTVDGGVLSVNGSIASSSSLTVNSGGTIGGNGTLPTTIVNGVIAPGNSIGTLTINGNLTLNAGSVTQIEVQGATSDKFIVTGSATLGGTLQLIALGNGPFVFGTPTTIITAAGGTSGSFASVNTNAAFGVGVTSTVTYSANAVQITLRPGSLIQAFAITRPENVVAVATGIDRAVAAGGDGSPFFALYNQPTQAALTSALNSLSGEVHTSANALGLQASDQFMRVMLDRTNTGRSGGLRPGQPAGYDINVWGAAFGQTGRMPGEAATIGSSRRNASDWNIAFGADMRVHPTTIVGIAAAGGQGTATVTGGAGLRQGRYLPVRRLQHEPLRRALDQPRRLLRHARCGNRPHDPGAGGRLRQGQLPCPCLERPGGSRLWHLHAVRHHPLALCRDPGHQHAHAQLRREGQWRRRPLQRRCRRHGQRHGAHRGRPALRPDHHGAEQPDERLRPRGLGPLPVERLQLHRLARRAARVRLQGHRRARCQQQRAHWPWRGCEAAVRRDAGRNFQHRDLLQPAELFRLGQAQRRLLSDGRNNVAPTPGMGTRDL